VTNPGSLCLDEQGCGQVILSREYLGIEMTNVRIMVICEIYIVRIIVPVMQAFFSKFIQKVVRFIAVMMCMWNKRMKDQAQTSQIKMKNQGMPEQIAHNLQK